MIFERGDRFADEAVKDNREYIILPAVITKKPSIKIVDNWRQPSNSSSVTKIPALINSSVRFLTLLLFLVGIVF